MNAENRPSPDILLQEAQSEHRGKLKIFLGAAPGVGKTYAMLSAAKTRIAENVDTVIGIVETHRRSETEALAQGMETVSKQTLDYRGLGFEEMDIDAILKRKPKLVLVDELAHTNIPGARHPKRYQDVQEILENGIDVYSTLNVQHIESLNDIVARITGVTVRETVPDTLIQMAHAIELIDLPPDELLQRLKDGKVYIPEQARLAVNRFFTPGNLTALRELALRQAAERVDDQMATYMRRHSISGPWPTSNRILVCISSDKQAAALVRTARRSAERRQAPWLVVYVETSRHQSLSEAARNDITQAMEIAQNMGAETMTATNENIAEEILRIAREHNVSTIIIGKTVRSFWSRLMRPSTMSSVLKQGQGFDILLVNNSEVGKTSSTETRRSTDAAEESHQWTPNWRACNKAGFVVAIATLMAWAVSTYVPLIFLPFIYTIAILLAVIDLGLSVSLFATALSGIALDVIMTYPQLYWFPQTNNNFVALLLFIATGISTSFIGDRLHRQIKATRTNAERTQSLYDFTKSIAAAATTDDVAQATVRRVATALGGARTALLLPRHEHLELVAAVPADLRLDTASNAAMDWAWQHRKPAGWRSDTLPGAEFYGIPLQAGNNVLGVLAVRTGNNRALTSEQNHFLTSLAYQAATALERAKLVTDVAQARLQTETEKLRTSLLSSISHDLRVPLDSIISVARLMRDGGSNLSAAEQRQQISLIAQEADRLGHFIENLLDMTELVTGNARFTFLPVDLRLLIEQAIAQISHQIKERTIQFTCDDDFPIISCDAKALHRVFVNLIENACTFSPTDQPVVITAERKGYSVKITVTDRGAGIPENERERVFDMFYRIKNGRTTGTVNGAGLGLSICRGFIEAHQGKILARSGADGIGTSIIVRLPIRAAE